MLQGTPDDPAQLPRDLRGTIKILVAHARKRPRLFAVVAGSALLFVLLLTWIVAAPSRWPHNAAAEVASREVAEGKYQYDALVLRRWLDAHPGASCVSPFAAGSPRRAPLRVVALRSGALFNPVVVDESSSRTWFHAELPVRCPNGATPETANMSRPTSITVRYVDEAGAHREEQFAGSDAACIYHYLDEFDGVLHPGCAAGRGG